MNLPRTTIEKIKERFDILTSAWYNLTQFPVVSRYWLSREDDQELKKNLAGSQSQLLGIY
jgi:hypothetical protein